jgi:hypothetical protein
LKRSDNRGRGPRVGVCVRIDSDLHHRQRGIAECGVDALPPDGGLEAVGYLQPPKRRDNRPPVDDLIEPRISFRGTLVFKTPAQRQRRIEDQAQRRPSSIRSRISRLPRVTPLLIARIRWAAARAVSRLNLPLASTRRATSLPCRVMVTSSPCATQSSNCPNLFFASKAPTSHIRSPVKLAAV